MQAFFNPVSLVFILHGLFLQSIWLYLGRISRNGYLSDIMTFRTPSSRLSRYYRWRVTSFENAIKEGIVFLALLVSSLYALGFSLFPVDQVNGAFLIVVFVVFLTFLSALQHAWRVKEIVDGEGRINTAIQTSTDKIGVARMMVDDLYLQGDMGDGRTWFALFKLAQRQDQVGWVIRDVLLEKGKEEDSRFQRQSVKSSSADSSTDSGPEID
ncbi:hypothetical protein E4H12_07710 [Candidatus Thorarchaeota archaeon]|nr:hypothetical protein [Candidatus Thorarchaeota archaeon]TFG97795.1 MAG: hypothetical protein E4H12_07710 [Candidatus Thorarchaeota archaeon]